MSRPRPTRNDGLLVCLVLLVVVVVTYAASLGNGAVSDDPALVIDNPYLRSLRGLGRLWTVDMSIASSNSEHGAFYRPFTMSTYGLNALLGGGSPTSFHVGNLLVHVANAMLFALFARRATAIGWRSIGLVALLFAVAPVCSEPVLWISGRFDLLVVTFALLALLASRREGKLGLALTLAAVSAGLLCKESFLGWVPLLLVDDWFIRRAPPQKLAPKVLGLAAITGLYLGFRHAVGVPSLDVVADTGTRSLLESFVFLVGEALRELIAPTALNPFRPYVPPSLGSLLTIIAVVGVLFAVAIDVFLRHRESTMARFALFGLAWFVLAMAPSAVVGPTSAMVGDRYSYLPLVGLFLALLPLFHVVETREPRASLPLVAAATAIAIAWAVCTAIHGRAWRDDRSLVASSLESDPENPYALYWLGSEAVQQGRLDEADALLSRSMVRNPGSWRTWNAVCYLRLHQDRLAEAEPACLKATALKPTNPRAWVNLASVYLQAGRWNEALASAERALALKPAYAEAHYVAGVAAANLGQYASAASHVTSGLAVQPAHDRLLGLQADLARYQRTHAPAPPRPPAPPTAPAP